MLHSTLSQEFHIGVPVTWLLPVFGWTCIALFMGWCQQAELKVHITFTHGRLALSRRYHASHKALLALDCHITMFSAQAMRYARLAEHMSQ